MTRFEADWAAFIEEAHSAKGDDEEWCLRVGHAATSYFRGARSTWIALMEHKGGAQTLSSRLAYTSRPEFRPAIELAQGTMVDENTFRAFFFPAHIAISHTEIERTLPPAAAAPSQAFRRSLGIEDMIGLISQPVQGQVLCMGTMTDGAVSLTSAERVVLTRVALHLESAFRLRKHPESVKAVIDEDGRVLDRLDDLPELASLPRMSTRSIELWPALVSGRLSLVPRGKGRSRRLLLVENVPASRQLRALDQREVDVLRLATRGLSTKMIAYALGTSSTRVSVALSTASAKLGAASRLDLVRLGAMLTRDPRGDTVEPSLTASEREVLRLLQRGLSNEAIAKMRGRSVRTIANQVAALLRKTGTSSRRALASRNV